MLSPDNGKAIAGPIGTEMTKQLIIRRKLCWTNIAVFFQALQTIGNMQ